MTAIIASAITAVLALIGTMITAKASNDKMKNEIEVSLAVLKTEISELTREVREHNNFAQRMPILEQKHADCERRIEKLEKAVDALETKVK